MLLDVDLSMYTAMGPRFPGLSMFFRPQRTFLVNEKIGLWRVQIDRLFS